MSIIAKIIDVTSVEQIGLVKTFGSLSKLPASLLAQTIPHKSKDEGPNSASSPVDEGGFEGKRNKRRKAGGNSNSNNNHSEDDDHDMMDFASHNSHHSVLHSKTLPAPLRQSSAEGPLKLPAIGVNRNVSSS